MDRDVFKDGEIYRYLCYGSEDSPPEDPSPHRITRLSHLLPPSTNLNHAFNAVATTALDNSGTGTYDEYESFLEGSELSSLLRLAGRSHYILPSSSSSISSSSSLFSPRSCSRSSYNDNVHSPPVKMEFNEDVLVMDGILLNQMSSGRSSRSSLLGGSSSSSTSGANYCGFGCGGICKHSFRTRNKSPFVVFGKKKGRIPDPRDELPKVVVTSNNLWRSFNRAQGIIVSPPSHTNTAAGASEDVVSESSTARNSAGVSGDAPSSDADSSSASKSHTQNGVEDSDAFSKPKSNDDPRLVPITFSIPDDSSRCMRVLELIVELESEEAKKSKEIVWNENLPKRGKRLPIFEEIAPS